MMNINRHGSELNYDRISSLPDDVRTHILSFLSTREAVQTCILSKRWINTWASVPDLEFDIKEFGLPKIVDDDMAVEFVTKFKLLVKSVLEKREISYVNRFRLCLAFQYWLRTQAVVDCIGDVMKLGPQECLVEMGSCENLNLNTDLIFTCASLTYLQLCLFTHVDPNVAIKPNSVNLPCLKTLNLHGVSMSDDSFKKLLVGCPVLEELVLEGCYIGIIEICSNTLKKLVLWSDYDHEVKRLQISTPNLLYLDIYVLDMGDIMFLNMPSLVDAYIYINDWNDWDKYVTWRPMLIDSLSNVESLRIDLRCSKLRKVLKNNFSDSPVFNNLKRLTFLDWGLYDFDLVPFFLLHSPKLHELTLDISIYRVREFLDEKTTQEGPGDALVQREFLHTVRFVGYKIDNGFVDRRINKLLVHVKIIGDIIIDLKDDY